VDPNATLREALEALADYAAHCQPDDLESAAIRFRALADWLDRGGVPPAVREASTHYFPHATRCYMVGPR